MAEQEVAVRKGQEGGRWVNERPSGEDVAKWFEANVDVADGLDISHYVSGLTLISSVEKVKETIGFRENGSPVLQEMEHSVFVPYVKVETRVKYFHDLMAQNRDEWVGFIEPVPPEEPNPKLPPGFFRMVVSAKEGDVPYICSSMKVTVYKRGTVKEERVLLDSRSGLYEVRRTGEVLIDGAPAVKAVPLLTRYRSSDPNAVMKAETGAVGRALGFAGMLVAPGSGVATAEDMEEAQRMEGAPPAGGTPGPAELPGAPGLAVQSASPEELRPRAVGLIGELEADFPDRHKAFLEWCSERKFAKVSELNEAALKGIIRKVENELDEGRKAAASAAEGSTAEPAASDG